MKAEDIITNLVNNLKTDLANSLQENGRYATGETIQELETVVYDQYGALLAPFWILALEDGRKPTPPDAPKGDPTLQEALVSWCQAKGIPEKASYAIAQKIHKQGYPGKPGVISVPLGDDNVNKRLDEAAGETVAMLFNTMFKNIP